jgi:hypothetical protein
MRADLGDAVSPQITCTFVDYEYHGGDIMSPPQQMTQIRQPYDDLCAQVKRQRGRIRLAPADDGAMAVTVTVVHQDGLPRAIGFVSMLGELDTVAELALWWLTVVSGPDGRPAPQDLANGNKEDANDETG